MAKGEKIRFDKSGSGAQNFSLSVDDKSLDSAAKKVQAFGLAVRNAGLGITVTGGAVTAALASMANAAANLGQQLSIAAQRTGVSAAALSELRYAATQTGTDLDTLDTSLGKMSKFLLEAAQNSQSATLALQQLHLSMADLQNLNPEQRFYKLADALSKVGDENLRQALAMEVFGRNGRALLPMLADGAAGLEKWRQRARDLNLGQTAEDVKALASLRGSMNDAAAVMERIGTAIGEALAPVLKNTSELIAKIGSKVVEWIDNNRQIIVTVYRVATGVTAAGVAIAALGVAISALGALSKGSMGLGDLLKVVTSLISPLGLVTVAAAALGGYLVYTSRTGGAAMEYLGKMFGQIKEDGTAAFKGIINAMSGGQWALAAKIGWTTIKMEAQRAIIAISDFWNDGIGPMKEAWKNLLTTIASMTSPALAYLGTSWSKVGDFIRDAFVRGTNFAVLAFTTLEVLATHWRDALNLAAVTVELSFVRLWQNVKANAADVIGSMLNAMFNQIVAWTKRVWAFLQSAFTAIAGAVWTSLVTGAPLSSSAGGAIRNAIGGAGPAAASGGPRQKTALEQSLEARQAAGIGDLHDAIQEKLVENQQLLDAMVKKLNDALAAAGDGLAGAGADAKVKLEKMKKELQDMLDAAAAANKAITERPENKLLGAGSIPLVGAHAAGTFNASAVFGLAGSGTADRIAKHTERTAVATEQQVILMARLKPNGGVVFVP